MKIKIEDLLNINSSISYGWKKHADNFTFVSIKNAGHMVPRD